MYKKLKKFNIILPIIFLLFFVLPVKAYNDPTLYYKLNDNLADTNVIDSSGNILTGTSGNNTQDMSTSDRLGISNSAFYFNGTSDYITLNNDSKLTTESLSISLWINMDTPPANDGYGYFLIGKEDGTFSDPYLWLWLENTGVYKFQLDTYNCGATDTNSIYGATSTWIHLVAVFDGSTGDSIIYRNGVEVARQTNCSQLASDLATTTKNIYIGKWADDGSFFDGKIDDIRWYDYVLNANDVTALYKGYADYDDFLNDVLTPQIEESGTFVVGFVTNYWKIILSCIIIWFFGRFLLDFATKKW